MIACPECGAEAKSTEARATKSGTRRRRRCVNGHYVTTLEVVLGTTGPGKKIGDVVLVPTHVIHQLVDTIDGLRKAARKPAAAEGGGE